MAGLQDWPQAQPRRLEKARRYIYQTAAALVIFLLLLALKGSGGPLGTRIQRDLHAVLTTEWNYQPVFERVVRHGLEAVDVSLPFLEEQGKSVAVPAPKQEFYLPVSGRVVRQFGWSKDPADGLEKFHSGVDIETSTNTPVKAVAGGEVIKLGADPSLGSLVVLDHGKGITTLYAQLQGVEVTLGQKVAAGQVIGLAGIKGDILGSGLHFEYREQGHPVNPLDKIAILKAGDEQ